MGTAWTWKPSMSRWTKGADLPTPASSTSGIIGRKLALGPPVRRVSSRS